MHVCALKTQNVNKMWRTIKLQNVNKFKNYIIEINKRAISNAKSIRETKKPQNKKSDSSERIKNIELAQNLFGFDYTKAQRYVIRRQQFQQLDPNKATKTVSTLKSFGIPISEISKCPTILNSSAVVIRNRYQILLEAGFSSIGFQEISKFLRIYNSSVELLRKEKRFKSNTNVIGKLMESFELTTVRTELNEKLSLRLIRIELLLEYMKQTLGFDEGHLKSVRNSYFRKFKSAASVLEIVRILKDVLKYDNQRIQEYFHVFFCDPVEVKEILHKFDTIAGINTTELLYRRPLLLIQDAETISKRLNALEEYKISNKALSLYPEILCLSEETVRSRLKSLKTIKDFDCLVDNPRIASLIYNYKKAVERQKNLQDLELKCVSLAVILSPKEYYERYIHDTVCHRKGSDTVNFLFNHFGGDKAKIRKFVTRHLYWKCIPVSVIKENLLYLLRKGYTNSDIYKHLHLLLYPTTRVRDNLEAVIKNDSFSHSNSSQKLSLVLYGIEKEYHFTGDGIWPDFDAQDGQQTDPFERSATSKLFHYQKKDTEDLTKKIWDT